MIRGRRAHGAALATLPTCAHLSPDSQARLHRAGSVPCKPKTLKMSAYGTFSLLRDPKGLANTVGAAHTCSPRGRGAGKTSCTLTTEACRLQPVSCCYAVASQALTGFQLRPLRLVLLPPRRWRGQGRRSRAFYPLTPWNRPTLTTGVGRVCHLPPAASQVRFVGKASQGLVFCF